jgi:hypothetical protein
LKHLKGGYDIIKGILAIGLGIESLPDENTGNFNHIFMKLVKKKSIFRLNWRSGS